MRRLCVSLAWLVLGCSAADPPTPTRSESDERPPSICRTPAPHAGPWFTEVTDEVFAEVSEPLSTGVVAGDLDGDGYDDLIAAVFPSARRQGDAPRLRFVLMNRPSPSGGRSFVDATAASGLLTTADGGGERGFAITSLGDLDNDGDLDVVACPGSGELQVSDPCAAFLNDGAGHFALVTAGALSSEIFWVTSSVMLDADLDGVLDFLPATVGSWQPLTRVSRMRMFRGSGDGSFIDISAEAGLPPDAATAEHGRVIFGVTSCDVDLDGDRDVMMASYGRQPNFLWLNDGYGHFTDAALELGVAFDHRADFSDDESYRCFCANTPSSCPDAVPAPSDAIQCPLRGWSPGYSDAPHSLGGNTFSIGCADFDDDGDQDLITAEVRHGDVGEASDRSEILENVSTPGAGIAAFARPGRAAHGIERAHTGIFWDEGDNVSLVADLDHDGRKDLFVASSNYPGTEPSLFRGLQEGGFEDVSASAGAGHASAEGPVLVDFDADGDLDLVVGTGTFNGAAPSNALRVYRNDVADDANMVRIRLVGAGMGGANRSAIGARVTLIADGREQHQEVLGSWGHSNTQSSTTLTFGLGSTCMVERLDVHWPNAAGSVSSFANVPANYVVEVSEVDDAIRFHALGDEP